MSYISEVLKDIYKNLEFALSCNDQEELERIKMEIDYDIGLVKEILSRENKVIYQKIKSIEDKINEKF